MLTKRPFLLIGKGIDTQWSSVLRQALFPLGELRIIPSGEAVRALSKDDYQAIIIDAGEVHDVITMLSRLRAQQPEARIVVATTVPTWQRAREALRAGAADYIRKSLDEKELCSKIQAVLETPPPSWPV